MLPLIFDTCVPRDEILSGDLSLDLFAAKLRLVVEGTAPQVYQDANKFFANTFATDGIKTLIREVFSRLMKQSAGAGWFVWKRVLGAAKLTMKLHSGISASKGEKFTDWNALQILALFPIARSPLQRSTVEI
ncbi:hypothetical protein [Microcoleus sp. herbarium5]|uniref:hypothetical protein n=1 Tax=Microcoleus sp. herbarium5 TaxID=3055434 RepID=UPI002FD2103D